MVDRNVSADSHMLVLDEDVLELLERQHHEAYLDLKGAHRRPGVSRQHPDSPPAEGVAAGRAGEWDPKERLADMDLDGVDAEVIYTDPTGGAAFYKMEPAAGLAAIRAF